MATQPEYDANSEAVRTHLTILQDVIRRMAGNSASCKNWCILLVAAILVLVARTDAPDIRTAGPDPDSCCSCSSTLTTWRWNRFFVNPYDAFVRKLHGDGITLSDLYVVRPVGSVNKQMLVSLRSTAVWPFYLMLVIAVALVWKFSPVASRRYWVSEEPPAGW